MARTTWTTQAIRDGFERFHREQGRLPTALEIDATPYLPSSRFIQYKFGGLEKLRGLLGYSDTHFGKGAFRSEIANRVNKRGRLAEIGLESLLRNRFGEVFVHGEKIFDTSKNRVDFYVYCPDGNFGIDVFCADSMRTLQSSVNIKMGKYLNFTEKLYFVVLHETLKQPELDRYIKAKRRTIPSNVQLVTLDTLIDLFRTLKAYPNPLST